ncbi:unnamed protein product [Cylindrotheca closterium]|uniref:Uncharacterized protein n=1 Tax=Cylindrotheca closterium TaxID=2856 RepID=A0AAD2PW06_9STRA|nr:unnamed protein product [Cylindrotheca closterium]
MQHRRKQSLIVLLLRSLFVGQLFLIATKALSTLQKPFVSQVTAWLNDEGISWCPADVPVQFQSPSTAFLKLDSSSILLHLIPTPTSFNETLPPIFNKRLTDLVSATGCEKGYSKVIHLFQDVWIKKNEIVKARLSVQSGEGKQRRIFARKTTVQRINATFAMSFLEEHHLWGATRAKYYFGLFLECSGNNNCQELVAVATFSARRRVKRDGWTFKSHELLRYCAQRHAFVVGGISKLCKAFINDVKPDDIVTVVDRDWGNGSGWHSIGFHTVATMDPLAMIVNPNEPGLRRHIVGNWIQVDDLKTFSEANSNFRRLGLPREVLSKLNTTIDVAVIQKDLAKENFFPVYDTGVERLFWVINSTIPGSTQTLWQESEPKYATMYYSDNIGIMSLLRDAAAVSRPLDSLQSIKDVESWKASGVARSAKLIFSAPSSMDPDATVEVRERENGWRTVGIVGSKKNPSIYHSMYRVARNDQVEPDVIVSEFIKTMAVVALAGTHQEKDKKTTKFLHFGFGAGTLVRYLANKVQNSQHVALELDHGVVDAAKQLIPDCPNVSILSQDALQFVAEAVGQNVEPFDCVCIDVFDEDLKVPEEFYSPSFMTDLSDNLLSADGILVQNFHSGGKRRETILQNAARASSKVFPNSCFVFSLDSKPNGGNAVLFASHRPFNSNDGDDILQTLSHNAFLVQQKFGLSFDAVARVQNARRIA